MKNVGERVAVVETHVEQLLEDGLRREEKQDEILTEVKKLLEAHNKREIEMNRYKGFLGGVVWILTAMGFVLWKFGEPFWTWVTKLKTGGS